MDEKQNNAPPQGEPMGNYPPQGQTNYQQPNQPMGNYQAQGPQGENYQPQGQNYQPQGQNYQPQGQNYQPQYPQNHPQQMNYNQQGQYQANYYQQPQPMMIARPTTNVVVVQTRTRIYPVLSTGAAVAVLIINIFLPGIGTMIMGCMSKEPLYWICLGFGQALLAMFIVGWVWAIVTGAQAVYYSQSDPQNQVQVAGNSQVVIV